MEQQFAYEKRLIEETFPVKEVSIESAKEKSIRQGHISTLHIWWARRPLASSRATAFAALTSAPNNHGEEMKEKEFIVKLSKWENSLNKTILEEARRILINGNAGKHPKVLDPFAGGGSIPLEAFRLGCETYASDYNPVATLILKCTLEYPQMYGQSEPSSNDSLVSDKQSNALLSAVSKWGKWILDESRRELDKFYPVERDGSPPVGFIWARTIPCQNPSCTAEIPLMRQFWLAKSDRKKIALLPIVSRKLVKFKIVGPGYEKIPEDFDPSKGTVSKAVATCLVCGSVVDDSTTRSLFYQGKAGERMVAVVVHGKRAGKNYRVASEEDLLTFKESEMTLRNKRNTLLQEWGMDPIPDEVIHTPDAKEYRQGNLLYNFTPILLYGRTKWGDLFNSRQKLALITFTQKVREAHSLMLSQGVDTNLAKITVTYLALAIDRFADYNSVQCMWHSTKELVAHTFGRQALQMVWDYVEVNPFSNATGNWRDSVDYLVRVLQHCTQIEAFSHTGSTVVNEGTATNLPYPNEFFDAVLTDPPYYDNVPYADLSDFFYVWLKRSIGKLYPELFSTPLTPKSEEVIAELPLLRGMNKDEASKIVKGIKSSEHFEESLRRSFKEIYRVLKQNGISVIVYAHKSTAGWETLVNSLLDSGLVVTGSWPIHTEMKSRLRAKESAALASSIYMISRKAKKLSTGFYKEVKQELESHLNKRLDSLWKEGISGADFFISAIGSAIQVFGIYEQVIDDEGQSVRADRLLEDVRRIVADYAVRQVLHNGFAAEISQMTRFYVLWRWAYGEAKLDFDDARKLASGVGIDLALEWNKGFIKKDNEFIEVLGPEERRLQDLEGSREIIDVLHQVLLLWKQGKNDEVVRVLKESGFGKSDVFYRVAQAISESLPNEAKEKKLLDGFLVGRQRIAENVRKESWQTRLFEEE
jgi:putative DNA methylase